MSLIDLTEVEKKKGNTINESIPLYLKIQIKWKMSLKSIHYHNKKKIRRLTRPVSIYEIEFIMGNKNCKENMVFTIKTLELSQK